MNGQNINNGKTESPKSGRDSGHKLHEIAKSAGFVNLKEFVFYASTPRQTLTNWMKNKPDRFDAILKGSIMRKLEALTDEKNK